MKLLTDLENLNSEIAVQMGAAVKLFLDRLHELEIPPQYVAQMEKPFADYTTALVTMVALYVTQGFVPDLPGMGAKS